MPSMSLADEELAMMVVAGQFDMPSPGKAAPERLGLSELQRPIPLADVYHGEPGASSLKWEGQVVCGRPGTDVYVSGYAWAPGGRPTSSVEVGVRVGECQHRAVVFGERIWRRGLVEPAP